MLFDKYQKEIAPVLKKELKIANPMALPRVEKVIINMRVSDGKDNRQAPELAAEELRLIVGQQPRVCLAKKAVSGFNLRKGSPIGLKVSLRGKRMYDFLEKFFSIVLPRLRDFRGIPDSQFDQSGNFNIGLRDHTIFPEVNIDQVKSSRGLQVTIVTNARNNQEARRLLELMGLPFAKQEE